MTQLSHMNTNSSKSEAGATTRRRFLQTTALAASAFAILPSRSFGEQTPLQKLNIAGIGVGGMGAHNLKMCSGENIVALCDVDQNYAAKTYKQYPKAKVYTDFREMLEKQKDIEAVIIATPDHTHAMIGLAAIRAKKHVYIQKPMAHSVEEVRLLTEAVREHKVASQMGNQGRSCEGARLVCEWIWGGVIGKIREVHAWTNRPVWPQGIEVERPKETPAVPAGLDWDKWIGPAQMRPYHPTYLPERWRAWWDFGTGSLGDLGCHVMDAAMWAMKFKYPESVEGCISTYWEGFWKETKPKMETYPRSTIVRYNFPARGDMPACRMTWWDGGMMPPRPEGVDADEKMGDDDGGLVFVGEKGVLICGCYGRKPRLYPESLMAEANKIGKSLPRVEGDIEGHEKDWIRSCKDGKLASSNFDNSGPLSEMVLMGNLAVRNPNRLLLWNGEKMEITNDKEANSYVRRTYRQGYSL